jgi:hypothetical protein
MQALVLAVLTPRAFFLHGDGQRSASAARKILYARYRNCPSLRRSDDNVER